MKRRRYPGYRAVALPWASEVPAHWTVERLRFAVDIGPSWRETGRLDDEDEVSFVPMEAVGEKGELDTAATKPLAEIGSTYTYFADGDVIVAKITPCFENGKGALARGLRNGVAFGTTELHVLRADPERLDSQFLYYLTVAQPFRALGAAAMYGAGGQKRVPEDFIKNFPAPLPPLAEQRAIAAFLDRQTARIDALIEKKRRLIELLQEKRAAVVTRAVTRGLDEHALFTDSGIDWLEKIPSSWHVMKLKYCVDFLNARRVPLSSEERADMEKTFDYYGASGVIDKVDSYLFNEPTILVAEDGANLLSRSTPLAYVARGKYWVNNHAHILRPRFAAFEYWEALLTTFDYTPFVSGSAQPKLTKESLADVQVPVPPEDEQQRIGTFIARCVAMCERATRRLSESVDMLAQQRSALIAAAVTGQIDVREAA